MKDYITRIIKHFLPVDRTEFLLFSVFFLLYASLALYIGIGTNITDQAFPMKTDAYFSFDNPKMMHHSSILSAAHPFLFLLTIPLLCTGIIFSVLLCIKAKTCFLLLVCSQLVTLSNIYVYRYLKYVVNSKTKMPVLLTLLYASTSTCLILTFTFESYLFSVFFLTFALYYYSVCLKDDKEIPLIKSTILAFILGGITVTNLAKGIIPLFFTTRNKFKFLKQALFIGLLFVVIVLVCTNFEFFNQILSRQSDFSVNMDNLAFSTFAFFWGAPIVFPKIVPFIASEDISVRWIEFGASSIYYFVLIGIILLLTIYSIIINIKNKQVQLLLSFFSIDIIIHVIFKYGADCFFIYGGHWVFIVPLLLGWLYKRVNDKTQKTLNYVYIALLICVIINNGYWIIEFMRLAKTLYPS